MYDNDEMAGQIGTDAGQKRIAGRVLLAGRTSTPAVSGPPPANLREVASEEEFNRMLGEARGPVLVDFFATWCGPCKRMMPELHSVAAQKAGDLTVLMGASLARGGDCGARLQPPGRCSLREAGLCWSRWCRCSWCRRGSGCGRVNM